MKKVFTLLTAIFLMATLWAQSPEKMSYQAVIRDASGNLVKETQVGMQISILQGSTTSGQEVYVETQTPTTNANGLISIEIGTGTTSDDFSNIDWANGPYFIKTETDPEGGKNYSITGTSQLLSVPYALHAKSANTVEGGITETDPEFTTWDKSTGISIAESQISDLGAYIETETDPVYSSSVASRITGNDTINWNNKLDSEIDPAFTTWDKSTGISITKSQISNLGTYLETETDPVYSSSVASGITGNDTINWNNKLDSETDPAFTNSEAANITATDITNLSHLSGTNTGDQDISGIADNTQAIQDTAAKIRSDMPDLPQGTQAGEMQYWNGSEWVMVEPGYEGATLTLENGVPTWVGGTPSPLSVTTPTITDIAQTTATGGGNVTGDGGAEVTARGVVYSTSETPALETNEGITTDGNGTGEYTSSLTGLTGETTYYVRAYAINSEDTVYGSQVSFTTEEGGQASAWQRDSTTAVVEVTNPETGKTWMDRNLGASQVADSSTDAAAYGDLYQWGRSADGHESRTSGTTSTLSSSDDPGHGDFITNTDNPNDWRSPQNDNLWQGVSGTNNPCPSGYRLPTEAEWQAEMDTWSSNDATGAFDSPLKLPVAGFRGGSNGPLRNVGSGGFYWSSTVSGTHSRGLNFYSSVAFMYSTVRALGYSVRCLKDESASSNPDLYPPTIETAYNNLGTQYVLIEWGDMAEAEEYEVYKAYSRDGSYSKITTTSNTSYQYTVNNNTDWQETLYFKVKSVDSAGRTSSDSNIESESIH